MRFFFFIIFGLGWLFYSCEPQGTPFGNNGAILTDVNGDMAEVIDLIIQTDGKTVVGGYCYSGGNKCVLLIRYNEDGSLDGTFGSNGILISEIGLGDADVRAIKQQPDGKLVIAGGVFNGSNDDLSVVRYNDNGTLDLAFGTDGIASMDFGGNNNVAQNLCIQFDGKIIVTGSDGADMIMVRYNSDGSLDNSFGTSGLVSTDFNGYTDVGIEIAIQSDGKIVMLGSSNPGSNFAVARYNVDGSLDNSFSEDGRFVFNIIGGGSNSPTSLVIQSDNKIVVAGFTFAPTYMLMARIKTNGNIDSTFYNNGVQALSLSTTPMCYDLAISSEGKIWATGTANNQAIVARFNTNGVIDASFGGTGWEFTTIEGYPTYMYSIGLQQNGKAVTAGSVDLGSYFVPGLCRYNTDGSLDK